MKKLIQRNYGYLLVLIAIVFLLITIGYRLRERNVQIFDDEHLEQFEDGWVLADGQPVRMAYTGKLSKGREPIDVYHRLPDKISEKDNLSFMSNNVLFEVYIDEDLIYKIEFDPQLPTGKSYGKDFHNIKLLPKDAGKTLRLHVIPIYRSGGGFSNICFGESGLYMRLMLLHKMPAFIISIFIFFTGIFTYSIAAIIPKESSADSLRGFATTALLVGFWCALETTVPNLLIGQAPFFRSLIYPILVILPYPIIRVVNGLMLNPSEHLRRIIFTCCLINITLHIVLYFAFGLDGHDLRYLTHIVLLITSTLGVNMVFDNIRYKKIHHIETKASKSWIGFLLLNLTLLMDLINYYWFRDAVVDSAMFSRVGFLLFSYFIIAKYFEQAMTQIKSQIRNDLYKKLAYTDDLTGIPNRNAFRKKEEEIKQLLERNDPVPMLCLELDLNFLKKVNDQHGHAIGDAYIKKSAVIMTEAFRNAGVIYRVGGDEFAGFIIGEDAEHQYEKAISLMTKAMDHANASAALPVNISIAYGAAMVTDRSKKGLMQAEIDADTAMYEKKLEMKATRTD